MRGTLGRWLFLEKPLPRPLTKSTLIREEYSAEIREYGDQWSPPEPAEASGCRPCPGRQCRQEFSGEFRKTGEISRFNLWRLISCAVRRMQPEPGTARTAATPPNNLRRSAQIRRLRELQSMVPEVVCYPADASGCRHCRPGGSNRNRALPGRRQRRPIICGEARRFEDFGNFNLWFPKSCAIPRQQVRAGSACPDGVNRSNVLTQCPVWGKL